MHGGIGRVDGGIGLSLAEPGILLEVRPVPGDRRPGRGRTGPGNGGEGAGRVLAGIRAQGGVEITLRRVYPPHIGLGSGSQIALAVARGICELFGRSLPGEGARPHGRKGRDIGYRDRSIRARGVHRRRGPCVRVPVARSAISAPPRRLTGCGPHLSSQGMTFLQTGGSSSPPPGSLPGRAERGRLTSSGVPAPYPLPRSARPATRYSCGCFPGSWAMTWTSSGAP